MKKELKQTNDIMNSELKQGIPKKMSPRLIILLSIIILLMIAIIIISFIESNKFTKNEGNSSSSFTDNNSNSSNEESKINYDDYYLSYVILAKKFNNNQIKIDEYDNCILNIDSNLYMNINGTSAINVLETEYNNINSCNEMNDAISNKDIILEIPKYSIESDNQIISKYYSNTSSTFNLESALTLLKNVDNSIYGAQNYYINNDTKKAVEKYDNVSYKDYYLYNNILFSRHNNILESNVCYKASTFESILKYYYGNYLYLSKEVLSYYNGYCQTPHYIIYDELNDCYVHEQPEMGAGCFITNNIIYKVNSFEKINNQYILKANILFYESGDDGGEKLSFTSDCDYDDSTCSIFSYEDDYLLTEEEYNNLFDENDEIDSSSIGYQKIISDSRLKEYSYIFEEYNGYYYYKGAIEN